MHLLTDIFSCCNPGRCYGRQGDELKVISLHHQVAIVENMQGFRFPAPVEKISKDPVAKSATQQQPQKNTVVKKAKAKTQELHPSLF